MKVKDLGESVSVKVHLLAPAAEYVKYKPSLLRFEAAVGLDNAVKAYRERLYCSR
jgi:hypothetical protein